MKVLITSDIHIHDFRQYNLFENPRFRLSQFIKLAHRLRDIAKEQQVEAFFIAGDFFHTAAPRPYIVNTGVEVLRILTSVAPVYMTQGQHDMDSRGQLLAEDTLLSVCNLIEGVHFLHKDSIELDGRSIYFNGWEPELDFSAIKPGEYDVLIGHATVPNSIINQYDKVLPEGQNLTNIDRFELAFLGDIHYHQVIDNVVIPGVPIQNNFLDHPDVGVIILDLDTMKWKRVPTILAGKWDFLQFLISPKPIDDEYIISKRPHELMIETAQDHLTKSVDVYDIISDVVKEKDLEDIHTEVFARVPNADREEVDLNFKLQSIHIQDFRSIKEYSWNFENGVTLLVGNNGAGKSSFIEAIRYVLLPLTKDTESRELARESVDTHVPSEDIQVKLELSYHGVLHTIIRGWGHLEYHQNGLNIDVENRSELVRRIRENLKFLDLFDLMYYHQDKPRFLSDYNYSGRVDLISRVLGLKIVDRLVEEVEHVVDPTRQELKTFNDSVIGLQAIITQEETTDFSSLERDYDSEIALYDSYLKTLEEFSVVKNRRNWLMNTIASNRKVIQEKSTLTEESSNLEFLQDKLQNLIRLRTATRTQITDHSLAVTSYATTKTYLDSELNKLEIRVKVLTEELSEIESSKCFTCGQELDNETTSKLEAKKHDQLDKVNSNIVEYKDKLARLVEPKASMLNKLNSKAISLDGMVTQVETSISRSEDVDRSRRLVEAAKQEISTSTAELREVMITSSSLISQLNGIDCEIDWTADRAVYQADRDWSVAKGKVEGERDSLGTLRELRVKIDTSKKELEIVEDTINSLQAKILRYEKYKELMQPKGPVMRILLGSVAEVLTSDRVRVNTIKELVGGGVRPDFSAEILVKGSWMSYNQSSGGQKTVIDTEVLKKLIDIVGGIGLLIFDETFKSLDTENLEYVVEIMKDLRSSNTFIVSHIQDFPYYDSLLKAELGEDATTTYTMT